MNKIVENQHNAEFNYEKPPIVEAIMGINTILLKKVEVEVILSKFKAFLGSDYSEHKVINAATAQFSSAAILNFTSECMGVKFTSTDKKYVLQVTNNHFAFSILGGYEGWNEFNSKAQKMWEFYVNELKPEKINRIAVRYINKIDIPHVRFELKEYFQIYPNFLNDNEYDMTGFFMQTQIKQDENALATINQTITTPSLPGYTSILLDLDVFEVGEFDPKLSTFQSKMEKLRDRKNNLFENAITDKTRKLFL